MNRTRVHSSQSRVGTIASCVFFALSSGTATAQDRIDRAPAGREFEFAARQNYFASVFRDDRDAFNRGKQLIKQRLEKQPDDYEGLFWHGSYTATEGLWAFQSGDKELGWQLWDEGVDAMSRAVELRPLDFGVRAGRGSRLLSAGLNEIHIFPIADPTFRQWIVETGLSDMELAYAIGQSTFGVLGPHERGQLLLLLSRGNMAIGKTERSRRFAAECVEHAAGSRYEAEARALLASLNGDADAAALLANAQPDGEPDIGPAAPEGEPLETLFTHILQDPKASDFFKPAGLIERLSALLTTLGARDENPDVALEAFERFAQGHGGSAWAWYGFASVLRSGMLFEAGQWATAVPIWEKGLAALERGVKDSDNMLGARLARGWIYAIVAKHEPDRAASGKMRATAESDLTAVADELRALGQSDSRAATLAALGVLASETGNEQDSSKLRQDAINAAESDAVRTLISSLLGGTER